MSVSREEVVTAIDGLLREIARAHRKPSQAPPTDLDVTVGVMHCMRVIERLGNPTMSELAEALRLHPSTVTTLVDALVERRLVERRDDVDDRRIVRVTLTEKGKRRRAKHREAMRARLRELMGDISDEDLRKIHSALTTLRNAAARKAEGQRTGSARDTGGDRAARRGQ